jgi:signal transduction histidine kinase
MNYQPGQILVVDDNQTNRLTLSLSLKSQGYKVDLAESGQQALAMLRQHPFDLLLLDIMMPDLDGYQVLAQIKQDRTLRDIPVIVISALEEMESVIKCIEMGAEDYLPRSFDPILLRARIAASLEKKRLRDQEREYLDQVKLLTDAAAAIEAKTFDPVTLADLAGRTDPLGQLARVFQQMAYQIKSREEELKRQNRVKSGFIGVITHELRSPFVSAALSVQLLQRYLERNMLEELAERIKKMDKELYEGRRMIDTLISFASLVEKQGDLYLEPTDLAHLIRAAVAPLEKIATARQIKLSYHLSSHLPPTQVDRGRMSEAIYQLTHNAIKFNHEGGAVEISCYATETQIVFKVKDTGPGIAPGELDHIWNAFAQLADEVKRGVVGLGLGLALVKFVIDAHQGEVAIKSTPGQGSTCGFRIPISGPNIVATTTVGGPG